MREIYFEKLEKLQNELIDLLNSKKVYKNIPMKEESIAFIRSLNIIEEDVNEHWSGTYENFKFKLDVNSKCIFELTYADASKYKAEELTINLEEYIKDCYYSSNRIINKLLTSNVEDIFDIIETIKNIESNHTDLVKKIKELHILEKQMEYEN